MSEPPDLLPCPFCGGKAEYDNDTGPNDEGFSSWIACNDCGAKTYDREDWNRRTPSPVGTAPMREAADALDEYEKAIRSEQITKEFRESRVNKEDLAAVDAARSRILALLPRSAPIEAARPREAWVYINPLGPQTACSSKEFADRNPHLEAGGKWFLFREVLPSAARPEVEKLVEAAWRMATETAWMTDGTGVFLSACEARANLIAVLNGTQALPPSPASTPSTNGEVK